MRTNMTLILLALAVGCGGTATGTDPSSPADADRDGYSTVADCDDTDAAIHPGATEVCGDSVDQDCSGGDLVCPTDTTAPILSGGQPTGTLPGGTTHVTMRVATNEAATCKWDTPSGTAYVAMASTFTTTGTISHNTELTGLSDGQSYTRYVRCQDGAGNANASDYVVSFGVGVDAGPLAVSVVASRGSGVAPLSVFFDAVGTTSTETTRPFHALEYRWDFGDPAGSPVSGTTWGTGSGAGVNSRNLATGPVAAHVYEIPGTYTVALSVTDGANTVSGDYATIVVQDPDVIFSGTNTICVAAMSVPTAGAGGCPAGATTAQQSDFTTAISNYATTGKRVLFKRGDTFVSAGAARVAVTGPGTIGAYGTGAKPTIQAGSNVSVITLSSQSTPTIKDWRVMDLYLDGMSRGTDTQGVNADGGINQVTLLRLDVQHVFNAFNLNSSILMYHNGSGAPGHRIYDELVIADSSVASNTGYGAFLSCHYCALAGNLFATNLTGTPTRFSQLVKAVVSNNTLADAAPTKELIKLHAPLGCSSNPSETLYYVAGCTYINDPRWPIADVVANDGSKTFGYSEYIIIGDNKLVSGSSSDYMMTAGVQNGSSDERTRNWIFERNWLVASASTQMVMGIMSRNVTVRNNICDVSLRSLGVRCFNVGNWGIEPPPDDVHIYNNTVYSSSSGTVQGLLLFPVSTNVTARNNLGYTPAAGSSMMVDGTAGSGFSASNNSTNAQMRGTDPKFVSPLGGPDGFRIASDSYAVGTGAVVPVWSDFFLIPHPATRDMGAVIH